MSLPVNRSDLYEGALRILLEKWAAEKRIHQGPICPGLTTKWELILLEQIAGSAFEEDRIFFTERNLLDRINRFLREDLHAPDLGASDVLEAIEIQQGILVMRSPKIYSFSHLTLQEYLAAQHFVNTNQIDTLVKSHVSDGRWMNVFYLIAGSGRADNLLMQMAMQINELILSHRKANGMLKWVEDSYNKVVAGNSAEQKSAARRAGALLLALAFNPRPPEEMDSIAFHDLIYLADGFGTQTGSNQWEILKPVEKLMASNTGVLTQGDANNVVLSLRKSKLLRADLLDSFEQKARSLKFSKRAIAGTVHHGLPFQHDHKVLPAKVLKRAFLSAVRFPMKLTQWTKSDSIAFRLITYASMMMSECKLSALSIHRETWNVIAREFFRHQRRRG